MTPNMLPEPELLHIPQHYQAQQSPMEEQIVLKKEISDFL